MAKPITPDDMWDRSEWFWEAADLAALQREGFRFTPGGVHLSKTMMLADLRDLLQAAPGANPSAVSAAVLQANALGKPTGTARRLALAHLNTLYGVKTPRPLTAAMLHLWHRRTEGRPLLALLCALAREPLLRDSVEVVLAAKLGEPVRWPDIAASLDRRHPGRYSPKMLKSLAQNCASTWTQAGFLAGKVRKRRSTPQVTAETAAYAALLGALAGFGGPALLASPWMRTLDRPASDLLRLLRAADAAGLLRLRAGGGVIEINVRRQMTEALGVPDLANGR